MQNRLVAAAVQNDVNTGLEQDEQGELTLAYSKPGKESNKASSMPLWLKIAISAGVILGCGLLLAAIIVGSPYAGPFLVFPAISAGISSALGGTTMASIAGYAGATLACIGLGGVYAAAGAFCTSFVAIVGNAWVEFGKLMVDGCSSDNDSKSANKSTSSCFSCFDVKARVDLAEDKRPLLMDDSSDAGYRFPAVSSGMGLSSSDDEDDVFDLQHTRQKLKSLIV